MKTRPTTSAILLTVFAITIMGSVAFTQYSIYVLSSLNVSTSQIYTVPPYEELLVLLVALFGITALFIYLIKRGLQKIIFWSFVAISWLILFDFFQFILSAVFALIVSILLVLYYYRYSGRTGRNVINVVIFLTVASTLSLALGLVPSVILTAIIAIYDYIAVYKTKHMIKLAKGISEYGSLAGFVFQAKNLIKKRAILLGGGDVVFPAVLINSVFTAYGAIASTFTFAGALTGLWIIIAFGKRNKAYPAMSFIGPLELLALGIFLMLSMLIRL